MSDQNELARNLACIQEIGNSDGGNTLGAAIAEIMRPMVETMSKLLENNTAALEQLSAAQSIQNDRLEALEKQIRLQTPVSGKQVSYINDAIRERSRVLLDKRGIDGKKAAIRLGNAIRKAVLMRYGVGSLREVPKHEYGVVLSQIEIWNDALILRDVVKEAREHEGASSVAGLATPGDAEKALPGEGY